MLILDKIRDSLFAVPDLLRAILINVLYWKRIKRVGYGFKIRGASRINIGSNVCFGRLCWVESVYSYSGIRYTPCIVIKSDVAFSDLVHVSCVSYIEIGCGTLVGSKVYIGDHNHGFLNNFKPQELISPRFQKLQDIEPVIIGSCCWIGDGAVILGGASIANNSVVAANSVVTKKFDRPCILGGVPAKVIKFLDI